MEIKRTEFKKEKIEQSIQKSEFPKERKNKIKIISEEEEDGGFPKMKKDKIVQVEESHQVQVGDKNSSQNQNDSITIKK